MHEAALSTTCVQFGGSFFGFGGWRAREFVQCWTGRQECGHYVECGGGGVGGFIVPGGLVGEPARIWTTSSRDRRAGAWIQ